MDAMGRDVVNSNIISFSTFIGNRDAFRGQNIQHVLELEIAKKISYKNGYSKGIGDHEKFVVNAIRKKIEDYQNLTARIADCVREIVKGLNKPTEIRLKEARTDLSKFLVREITLLFVLDMKEKEEVWFTTTLNKLATEVFEDEKIYPELLFVNVYDKKIDTVAISSAYPSVRVYKDA